MGQPELIKGASQFIILAILAKEPRYGYDIARQAKERSHGQFLLKEGTLYVALRRLEESGDIHACWSEEASGGGKRKYYTVTDKGRKRLQQQLEEFRAVKALLEWFGGNEDEAN